jgi:hypothetical protein
MTKEEWALVEKALGGIYGSVELEVDGRMVSFQRGLVGKDRLGCMTYIDGEFKGLWVSLEKGYPESKYLAPKSRYVYTLKRRNEMKKLGKKFLKEYGWDPEKKHEFVSLIWLNGAAIRRHYQKTFTAIKLTKVNGVDHP